ncbi:hypothetical protein CF140_10835 [Aeromonas sobria]|nr:hypothetical protein CF140_10835 [Aeromonas sobria]
MRAGSIIGIEKVESLFNTHKDLFLSQPLLAFLSQQDLSLNASLVGVAAFLSCLLPGFVYAQIILIWR